jgi:CIC family chloride channel protein
MHSLRAWFGKSSPTALLLLGLVVGIGGAFGAALFHTLIYLTTLVFYQHDGASSFIILVEEMPVWKRLLIPTLGGLLVGIIFKYAKVSEAEGEGVPEVTEALAHKRGTIRPLVAPVKIITAALTLGSGGSAGREGPVIQIGSAIGSSIAQFFKQATPERSLLLAAGAAAGIGGTFGAPMAGVLFTLEILHHRPNFLRALVIIIAAFTGAFGNYLITGHNGLRFDAPLFPEINVTNITSLLFMSVLAAGIALLFGYILSLGRKVFARIELPHLFKPAIGGLLVGIIGLWLPFIHEPAAYPLMIDIIALSTIPISALAILLVLKMFSTSLTLGSGGSGGIFAPLLLMGAIAGSIFGSLLLATSLGSLELSQTLVIVGMATVFAAAAHAPLTAAFITYEMTENFYLLLPLMVTCYIAAKFAKQLKKENIYEHDTLST